MPLAARVDPCASRSIAVCASSELCVSEDRSCLQVYIEYGTGYGLLFVKARCLEFFRLYYVHVEQNTLLTMAEDLVLSPAANTAV